MGNRRASVKASADTGGCSSMVEQKPSKLTTRVRFPSPAPIFRQSVELLKIGPTLAKRSGRHLRLWSAPSRVDTTMARRHMARLPGHTRPSFRTAAFGKPRGEVAEWL